MDKTLYFPPPVQAVKVTSSNLAEVAEWCGGQVAKMERKSEPGSYDSYVWVPTPKGASVYAAYPGMYVTKRVSINTKGNLKESWAVFHRDYFDKNYFQNPVVAIAQVWPKRVASCPVEDRVYSPVAEGRVSPEST